MGSVINRTRSFPHGNAVTGAPRHDWRLGWAGAIVLARAMASLLFGVPPFDPITLAVVPQTLLAVVLLATYLLARRAARLDPMGVLRND